MAASEERKGRRVRRSAAEKQGIVALTRLPGASVARVARESGVNANQVHAWRRLEAQGRLGAREAGAALLAVRVAPEDTAQGRARPAHAGGLWVELRRGSVRVENGADPLLLRIVLEQLAR